MGVNSLPKTVSLNSGAFSRDGAKADRRWTLQPLKVPNISQCFSKVCEIFNGTVKSINQSINQSIFVYYGMTKCRPTTRCKKAILLVRKKTGLEKSKPENCA